MKSVIKTESLKAKAATGLKIISGALIISGMMLGGATLTDNGYLNSLLDDGFEDTADLNNRYETQIGANESEDELVYGSQAVNSSDELVEVMSNDTESEQYHKYGC